MARKKHKRLDAICENVYNRNKLAKEKEDNDAYVGAGANSEARRSGRVRRAPVVLDASPSPSKKRRKFDSNGKRLDLQNGKRNDDRVKSCSTSKDVECSDEGEPNGWKSRLRSKGRNVGIKRKKKVESPRGKKKLFDSDEVKEQSVSEKEEVEVDVEEFDGGKFTVVKSKRTTRIEASIVSHGEELDIEANDLKNAEEERILVEMAGDIIEDCSNVGNGLDCEKECSGINYKTVQLPEEVDTEIHNDLEVEEVFIGNKKGEIFEQVDELQDQEVSLKEKNSCRDSLSVTEQKDFGGGSHDKKDSPSVKLARQPSNQASSFKFGKPRIKEGRRCGLCGAAADGKPPKILAYDMAESENDVCSGSSASEEPNYDIWDGFGDEPGWLGRLLGPINDRFGIAGVWVHQHCAVWSPEVYFAGVGCLKSVRAALCRGRALKCSRCGRRGATIGCRVDRCSKTYHLPCARAEGCIFDHRKFLIACTDHRHLFQPQGNQYLHRVKKMKAKKRMLEIKKMSNEAWRKDVDAEEKWLEGEDEEFLKRESKRLHRDILRIAPVYIGGSESESGKSFQGWESVAGLQDVIRSLKEVVILPLLYPNFFTNLGLTPPRGVLLHGYPGTGKTLVVRALIGACARGDKRIAYFARKGADCLGKYVGDAERQLRLLFQVAEKSQPSIIFFDEIDGLAPSRTRQQDQTHSSVVSTLLALMDGLKSRGSVVVIGATNRPEAVDPALRRPGRFDREIYFPLPSVTDRTAILSLHSQSWPKPLTGSLLKWIAAKTTDFAGADLQALCTQAAIIALKRNCPLQELLLAAEKKPCDGRRVPLPSFAVEERDWLEALSCAPPPCSHREAGMAANGVTSSPLPAHLVSCLMQPFSKLLVSISLDERLCLPPPLANAAKMIKNVIVTALNTKQVRSDFWWDHVEDLLQQGDIAEEIEKKFSCSSILVKDSLYNYSDVLNDGNDDFSDNCESSKEHVSYCNNLLRNTNYVSGKNSGLRILITGSPRSGQSHLVRCLLHCFTRNIQIQKVDLATTFQEGHGDVVQGLTEILMKCSSLGSCVLFMPKIDLWAINTIHQADKENSDCSSIANEESEEELGTGHEKVLKENTSCGTAFHLAKNATYEDDVNSASLLWNSFMEQMDTISVSTSLMILATSEVPYPELPSKIRKFFNSEISKGPDSNQVYTFPRFSVQADGNFNRDALIVSSAAKLSRDVVQQFLQLVHHGSHNSTTSYGEYKVFENEADVCCDTDHGPASISKSTSKVSEDYPFKAPLPHKSRQLKGKSSLLMAISALGYQLLGYPHFAELCWVTSKLKDGPFSDVNGPWKGWPFNTCIIRPNNLGQPVTVSSGSTSTKINKKSYVVRGLVAVGLLAFRGVYTSVTEVCLEIRKVLKLLVEKINDKIQAGKDRYLFVRILSQVAYLEDVVSSWAYTLQSLEQDIHVEIPQHDNPKPTDYNDAKATDQDYCPDNGISSAKCELFSERSSRELEMQEQNPGDLVGEDDRIHADLNNGIGGIKFLSSNLNLQSSCRTTDELGCLHLNTINSQSASPSVENTVENGFESIKYSNGVVLAESLQVCSKIIDKAVDIQNEGDHGNLESTTKPTLRCAFTESSQVCDKVNDKAFDFQNEGDSSNLGPTTKPTGHTICLYNICVRCIQTLTNLMQKNVTREWEQHGNVTKVEDVHDVVASLSINLLSALRRECATTLVSDIVKDPGKCDGQYSGKQSIVAMNCTSHCVSSTTSSCQPGINTKFIYSDGVLNPLDVDMDDDVSFHCKYETLSLSSLINWMDRHFPNSSN